MRVRSQLAMATHRFFQDRGFQYIHTPIITAADCEGVGEMFQVTTVLKDDVADIPTIPATDKSKQLVDYKKDFFGKPTFLTVSGQLAVEVGWGWELRAMGVVPLFLCLFHCIC